jgi:hypothetical protein
VTEAPAGDRETIAVLLERISRLVAENRQLVSTIAGAFIAEGRAFAETPEGRRCRAAIESSELLPRARFVWEAFGLREARPSPDTPLPSQWIGALVAASASPKLELVLSALLIDAAARARKEPTP